MGFALQATDGRIGKVKDMYFDDQTWAIQYLVADTGGWLTGRKVLISPRSAVGEGDWDAEVLPVSLTRGQIENSPPISEDEPVSRRAQTRLGEYYNWGAYWSGYLGPVPPAVPRPPDEEERRAAAEDTEADPHLRSVKEVTGYTIEARDGEIGHVEDFVVQTDGWVLRYMIADTRNWLPGRKVLVACAWLLEVDWMRAHVTVDLTRDAIRRAPLFEPSCPPHREYEKRLHEHYGKPGYWGGASGAGEEDQRS
ncbi:MAG: PRC-barrel domain-containing protein [Planctomycetota bacterium]